MCLKFQKASENQIQMLYKKSIQLFLGEARTTRQLWGAPTPHSLRRRSDRLHNEISSHTWDLLYTSNLISASIVYDLCVCL